MVISIAGKGNNFTDELDAAGIEYQTHPRIPGQIVNSAGDIINLAGPWAALATIIVAWLKARRASRDIIIETEDRIILHAKGYSVEEISQLLPKAPRMTIIETKPPEQIGDK